MFEAVDPNVVIVFLTLLVIAPLILLVRRLFCTPKGRRRRKLTVFVGLAYVIGGSVFIGLLWVAMQYA